MSTEPDQDITSALGAALADDDEFVTVTLGPDPHTGHLVTFRAKISDRDNPYLGWRRIEPVDGYIDVPAQWLDDGS